MRILAVDHGEKNIGLAVSDESGTIANPLVTLPHLSRVVDAAQVAERAAAHDVALIVVG
jgi:putative Holliday junction resolvase